MTRFLSALVKDLHNRVQNLISLIESTQIHDDLSREYVPQILGKLNQILNSLQSLASDEGLSEPALFKNYFSKYREYSEQVRLLEAYPLQVISRYKEADHYFFKLDKLICKQVGFPLPPPLISTISSEYYWTFTPYNVIAVPPGEIYHLLSLPDLYHEFAHFIYANYTSYSVGDFMDDLKNYIEKEKQRAKDEARTRPYLQLFEEIKYHWEEKWITEFACDMIATYLVGPAYGWANLKLLTNTSTKFEVFGPSYEDFAAVEHPSDEARMRAIYQMLRLLNLETELSKIDEKWREYLTLNRLEPPNDYDYFYPDDLLASLAKSVFQGAKNVGMISYSEQLNSEESTFSVILNQAWEKFLHEPEQYQQWEKTQLRIMISELATNQQNLA